MPDADLRVLCGQGVREVPGAVRGVVVHDENIRVRERAADGLHEARQVVPFVVSGRDHKRAEHVTSARTYRESSVRGKRGKLPLTGAGNPLIEWPSWP